MERVDALLDLLRFRIVTTLIVLVAALPLFFCGVYGLTVIQRTFIPVVVDFRVMRFEHLNPTRIEIWGDFNKLFQYSDGLAMCRYVDTTWWAELPDDTVHEVRWWTLERPFGQKVNRPPGQQTFGPWIIDYAAWPDAIEVYGVVEHRCLWLWPTETKLGPLMLKPSLPINER